MGCFAFYSCNEPDFEVDNSGIHAMNEEVEMPSSSTSDIVTQDDISRVAVKFASDKFGSKTRGQTYTTSTIYGNDGVPSAYVVNYANNKGWVILSATKRYLPILAYSDNGNFDVNGNLPDGLKLWKEETNTAIKIANQLPEDSVAKYRILWSKYEEPKQFAMPKKSKGRNLDVEKMKEEAQKIIMDSVSAWSARGIQVGSVDWDDEREMFIRGAVYPLFEDEWYRFAYNVEGEIQKKTTVSNFVPTTWGQQSGFNASYPTINGVLPPAGCGVIAAGQVMRYYKHPNRFNWDVMPFNRASKQTADFLYEFAKAAKAEIKVNATSTYSDDVTNALKTYGYNAELKDHDTRATWDNILNKIPVIMRGDAGDKEPGHMWVASGGEYVSIQHFIKLYVYTDPNRFRAVEQSTKQYYYQYFYMNWGWTGSYNGLFMEYSDLSVSLPNGMIFSNDRDNIFNITPKR